MFVGITPGDDRSQAGTADAGGYVASRKHAAVGGQPVEVRSSHDFTSHEAEIEPCLIVADDQDNVGWHVGGPDGWYRWQREQQDKQNRLELGEHAGNSQGGMR